MEPPKTNEKACLRDERNFSLGYDAYIHFAYACCLYLKDLSPRGEGAVDTHVVEWYLKNYEQVLPLDSSKYSDYLKRLYTKLLENLVYDKCVLSHNQETGDRIIKHNPNFLLWAWQDKAKEYENFFLF